jgi:hypothetical protein
MNKSILLTTAATFSLLGFAGGTYYGFKEGVNNLGLLEQIVQGALSRHQLVSIEKDRLENVVYLFEINIDSGLHSYVTYQKSGNKILSEYFMAELTSSLDTYVDVMAEYRKNHPIAFTPNWALPHEEDDEETRKWRAQSYVDSIEMLSEIKELLKSRGVPESALEKDGTLISK